VLFPGIAPALSLGIPDFRARLRLAVLDTRDVNFTIYAHVNLSRPEQQLIGCSQVEQKLLCQNGLEVKTIFEAEGFFGTIDEGFTARNVHYGPSVLMSPSRSIGQNLRFANTSIAPKENTTISTLEIWERNSSNIFWSPEAVANFMIGTKKKFVLMNFIFLEVCC